MRENLLRLLIKTKNMMNKIIIEMLESHIVDLMEYHEYAMRGVDRERANMKHWVTRIKETQDLIAKAKK